MSAGVFTQFLICEKSQGTEVGAAVAYGADLKDGYVYMATALVPSVANSGAGIEAVALFAAHLFYVYTFRKIYFEVPSYNLRQFGSTVGKLLKEEGKLVDHTYYHGRYWDRHILALYRSDFETTIQSGIIGKLYGVGWLTGGE